MVLKQYKNGREGTKTFENDVKMYGTQTLKMYLTDLMWFENDVKMYGTQTRIKRILMTRLFENDVKMYGTQTHSKPTC